MQSMVPLYGFGGGAGTGAALTVNAPAGVTVTVSKDGKTKTKVTDSDGVAVFKGLATGEWTITMTDGTDTAVDTAQINADYTKEMSFVKIYGIYRNITASSPVWAREDDAVGKTATASIGTVAGSSDFDTCYPWSRIARETLSTGDVMVKIPKFWFRRYRDGNIEHIKIADKPVDGFTLHPAFCHAGMEKDFLYVGAYKTSGNNQSVSGAAPTGSQLRAAFRTNAKSKGAGWGLIDIAAVSAIQMLILVEFANNNVQAAIGRGYSDDNSGAINTGSCDSVPNLTGRPSGTDGKVDVVWRGLEGFWGNMNEWVDGVNVNNGTYYVCNNPSNYADNTAAGYTALSYSGSADWVGAYITQLGIDSGENPHILLPSAAGTGSETTDYCDKCWVKAAWTMVRRSGAFSGGSGNGLFASYLWDETTDTASNSMGSRLQYIPQ